MKKKEKWFTKAFRTNEWGMADFPVKISNVRISRIIYGDYMGCSWCFPHGYETVNSTIANRQRNSKKFRKTKWKPTKVK
jgi:hypothetical protein